MKFIFIFSMVFLLIFTAQPIYPVSQAKSASSITNGIFDDQKSETNQAKNNLNSKDHEKEFFTLEQEEYLAQHPHVFAYFIQLYTGHKKTPTQIAREYKLRFETTQKYLKTLAKIGIIEMPKDLESSPHFLVQGIASYSADGPLSEKFTESMLNQHCQKSLELASKRYHDQDSRHNLQLSFGGFWLTLEEYELYQKDLERLTEKYVTISKENVNNKKMDTIQVSIMNNSVLNWEPAIFNTIKKDF